jgi:hypothetical protein
VAVSYATRPENASASFARLRADFAQIPRKAKSWTQKVIHILHDGDGFAPALSVHAMSPVSNAGCGVTRSSDLNA